MYASSDHLIQVLHDPNANPPSFDLKACNCALASIRSACVLELTDFQILQVDFRLYNPPMSKSVSGSTSTISTSLSLATSSVSSGIWAANSSCSLKCPSSSSPRVSSPFSSSSSRCSCFCNSLCYFLFLGNKALSSLWTVIINFLLPLCGPRFLPFLHHLSRSPWPTTAKSQLTIFQYARRTLPNDPGVSSPRSPRPTARSRYSRSAANNAGK